MPSDNVIGVGTRLEGSVFFDGNLVVQGTVCGSLNAATGKLVVAEGGRVEGDIEVARVEANGRMSGRIRSTESLSLGPQADVSGSIHYTTMQTTRGSSINAELTHGEG